MTLRATIFDLDGLLVDSETLWHRAEVEILGARGVPVTEHEDRATKGMFVEEVVRYWHGRYPWSPPALDDVVAQLLTRVGDLVEQSGRMLPGAERALDLASERGPIALASSTPMALIERVLDHFDLRDRFAVIRSAEDEPFGKPHPGVFLSAASDLDVDPPVCLVLEDSAAGVIAAKAARMAVVAVPVAAERNQAPFALADLRLDSLVDLSSTWLDQRFAPAGPSTLA